MLDLRLILNSFAVLCCLFAWWKGGPAERAASIVVLVNILVGQTGHLLAPSLSDSLRMANDGLTALVLLGITVRYGALWMGGVMLFFAVQFAMHSYYMVTGRPTGDYLYGLTNNINYLGIVGCLIIGAIVGWRARIRRRRSTTAPGPAT